MRTSRSSNLTSARVAPAGLMRVHGSTCFWPESAIAANHALSRVVERSRSHALMRGLSALFA